MLGDGGRTHRAGQALDLGGVDAGWRPLYFPLLLALANENARLCVPMRAHDRQLAAFAAAPEEATGLLTRSSTR